MMTEPVAIIDKKKEMRITAVPKEIAVSIVIPAFNEEAHIGSQIDRIKQTLDLTEWAYEVIVVDDGSTDNTARNALEKGIRLVSQDRNRGYGAALKAGIAEAQAEKIVIIDADGTYPCQAIPQLLAEADRYDMVVGARTGKDVHIPFERRPAKWILRRLANYLADQQIPDLNSGLRVLRKSIVERFLSLLPSGFSFTTSITLALMCNEYRVHYIPINYYPRQGKSKIRPIHAYYFFLLIVRTITYFNPLKVYLPLGGIFFLAGLSKLMYDLITVWNLSESAIMGFFFAGLTWAIGLLADLIAKVGIRERLG